MDCIESTDNPVSTRQLALRLGCSWHTAQQYCFELLLKGKIDRLVIGGSHIWIPKGSFSAKRTKSQEQVLIPFTEKQLTTKIDEAIEKLLNQEITHTVKEIQNSLKNKEQKLKQRQEEHSYEQKE